MRYFTKLHPPAKLTKVEVKDPLADNPGPHYLVPSTMPAPQNVGSSESEQWTSFFDWKFSFQQSFPTQAFNGKVALSWNLLYIILRHHRHRGIRYHHWNLTISISPKLRLRDPKGHPTIWKNAGACRCFEGFVLGDSLIDLRS